MLKKYWNKQTERQKDRTIAVLMVITILTFLLLVTIFNTIGNEEAGKKFKTECIKFKPEFECDYMIKNGRV